MSYYPNATANFGEVNVKSVSAITSVASSAYSCAQWPHKNPHLLSVQQSQWSTIHTDPMSTDVYSRNYAPVPRLTILREPQPTSRFRYAKESKNEGHGYLFASNGDQKTRQPISVQLENWYQGDAYIRCSLVTDSIDPKQHFHRLRVKKCNNVEASIQEYQDEIAAQKNNWTAEFSGLSILREKKESAEKIIIQRLQKENINAKSNEKEFKMMWANYRETVKLKFEAFAAVSGNPICAPVYSQSIRYKKNPNENELRIVKIIKSEGSCAGNEEVCMLVEQVSKKDIGIRFYETFNNYVCWSAEVEFSPVDVHHGFAIVFKTPPYRQNIQGRVMVQVQLYRKSDEQVCSDPKTFTYLPQNSAEIQKKRRFVRHASAPSPQLQNPFCFEMYTNQYHLEYQHPVNSFHSVKIDKNLSTNDRTIDGIQQSVNSQQFPNWQQQEEATQCDYNNPTNYNAFSETLDSSNQYEGHIECVLTFTDAQQRSQMETGNESRSSTWNEPMMSDDHDPQSFSNDASLLNFLSTWGENCTIIDDIQNDAAAESSQKESNLYMKNTKYINSQGTHGNSAGKTPLIREVHGNHALHYAVRRNDIATARDILTAAKCLGDKGQEFINAVNHMGLTPLHLSVLENQREATVLLLKFGADPNFKDFNGNTPVHLAAMDKYSTDCLRLLLDKETTSADINAKNFEGWTPFHLAVKEKNTEGAKLLMEEGANVACKELNNGRSALHTAVEKVEADIVLLLLQNKSVDINAQCSDGRTALDIAEAEGSNCIRRILISLGAKGGVWNNPETIYDDTKSELSTDEDADSEFSSRGEESDDFDIECHKQTIQIASSTSTSPIVDISNATSKLKIYDSLNLQNEFSAPKEVQTETRENQQVIGPSMTDCIVKQEKMKELDDVIVAALAGLLDSSKHSWEKLAESLDLPPIIKYTLEKQPNPLVHLLSNLDSWDVSSNVLLKKLRELQLEQAAVLLEKYLAA